METQFLKKYKLVSSINNRVQDFELIHPINKSIKQCQIYLDTEESPRSRYSHHRTVSQENRVSSSIILKPIARPLRNISIHFGDPATPMHSKLQTKPNQSERLQNQHLVPENLEKKENFRSFRIRSPRNINK